MLLSDEERSSMLKVFGFDTMKPFQSAVISAAYREGRDTLVLSGTGSGKSLCFQLPAVLSDKVVLVASPLISLMRDQVLQMSAKGLHCCFLGSAQADKLVEPAAMEGRYSLIYVCPETLCRLIEPLKALHRRKGIALFAIDESHCVSKWGHDFRPKYRQLGDLVKTLRSTGRALPVMALTATATEAVRKDIVFNLDLTDVHMEICTFYRPNLHFCVLHSKTARVNRNTHEEDFGRFFDFDKPRCPLIPGRDGVSIIYCPSRKLTERIDEFFKGKGIALEKYHAKLPKKHLEKVHKGFLKGRYEVVCCTCAFGMGINKANVRQVIHYGLPQSLEQLYQEAGRAGRDGGVSNCVLFADMVKRPSLLPQRRTPEVEQHCLEALNAVHQYAVRTVCRVKTALHYFSEMPEDSWDCGTCDICCRKYGNCEKFGGLEPLAKRTDMASDAHLLLAATDEMRSRNPQYSKNNHIVRMLRGRGKFNRESPFFGKGESKPRNWWMGLFKLLETQGLVNGNDITEEGRNFMALQTDSGPLLLVPTTDMLVKKRAGGGSQWADPEYRKRKVAEFRANRGERRPRNRKRNRLGRGGDQITMGGFLKSTVGCTKGQP